MQDAKSTPRKAAIVLCGGETNLSNLPIITNRSNAMIPVNGKPVIGWILDDLLTKGIEEVILVLRFDSFKLLNYAEWAFGSRVTLHLSFVQAGGAILHSLLAGLAWVRPGLGVHIILGDTLIQDQFPEKPDFVFAGPFDNSEDWCLVKTDGHGNVIEYFDKIEQSDRSLQALAGVYSLSDTALLRSLLIRCIKAGAKEISQLLREYGKEKPIAVEIASFWYDFGHIEYFNLAKRKLLQSRYFNSLEIDPLLGTITKRSKKSDKLFNELQWYKSLPERLSLLTPRLVHVDDSYGVAISQEYYGYPSLSELYVFGDLDISIWFGVMRKLMKVHDLFLDEAGTVRQSDVILMYWVKTLERIGNLERNNYWANLFSRKQLVINGKTLDNFETLKERVGVETEKLASSVKGCLIHGDYCFSNILYDLNSQLVRLIDPRGSFGEEKMFGDPRYDIAKLRHSVVGCYDFIMADLFVAREDSQGFIFKVFRPDFHNRICAFFDDLIVKSGYDKKEILFIEGLLFISMVPFHDGHLHRQLAMYLNGIIKLNEYYE